MSTNPKIQFVKSNGDMVADLFCGGGGTTTGAKKAFARLGLKFNFLAVNHWQKSIDSHQANHPEITHLCQSIDTILPEEVVPGRKLKLLMASPECTDHSVAKGGKPRSDQKRADAWLLLRWIEKLDVDILTLENVVEWKNWGPLNKKGLPDKRRRGEYFLAFINILKINYTVEWRVLNAADYGDATTRERFFLIAKKGKNRKIEFPSPTHFSRKEIAKQQQGLFGDQLQEWRSAASIIEWNRKGESIFGRKKPLCSNSMKRIYSGLRTYSGIDLPDRDVYEIKSLLSFVPKAKKAKTTILYSDDFNEKLEKKPFWMVPIWECYVRDKKGKIIGQYQYPSRDEMERQRAEKQAPIDEKVRQTPIKIDWTKCKPFKFPNDAIGKAPDLNETADVKAENEVAPFAVNMKGAELRMRHIEEPSFTQTTSNHQYLCETSVVANLSHTQNNDSSMCRSAESPLPVICGKAMLSLVENQAFMVQSFGERDGQKPRTRDIYEPTFTVTPQVRMNIVEPCLVKYYQGSDAVSVNAPVPTITANYEHIALTEPFVVPCNHGSGDTRTHSINEPMKTITQVDGFALVEPFLVIFKNNQNAQSVHEPIKTLTTKDSYGLVEIQVVAGENSQLPLDEVGLFVPEYGVILFIRFRMFAPSELARAMGFPEDYYFAGTRQDTVTQIGNAVPVSLAEAVVYSALKNEVKKLKGVPKVKSK